MSENRKVISKKRETKIEWRIIMEKSKNSKIDVRSLIMIPMMSAIIAVCSWISIPMTVPFTLQIFGIYCALGMLGGKNGTISVVVYIMLGLVGVPVFAGFSSGISTILGPTGGYILGFAGSALVYWLITKIFGSKIYIKAIAMLIGLLVCYAFGTIWFIIVYGKNNGSVSIATALSWCVIPYIIPDLVKIFLALVISDRVMHYMPSVAAKQ